MIPIAETCVEALHFRKGKQATSFIVYVDVQLMRTKQCIQTIEIQDMFSV